MDFRELTETILQRLTRAGADMASCTAETVETREFNVNSGSFSLYRTLYDKELTLTAYRDHRRGVVKINRFDEETIAAAVTECITVTQSGAPDEAWRLAPNAGDKSFRLGAPDPDMDAFFARTKELKDGIETEYPKIIMEMLVAFHKTCSSVYRNTNGAVYETLEGYYALDLEYSAHDGEESSSFFFSSVVSDSLDRPLLELGSIQSDLEMVQRQIRTVPVDGKFTGSILLPPGCLSVFLENALEKFAGDRVLLDGTSIWRDKLGKAVADPRVTLSIAPLSPQVVCGERYTDEGFLSENYNIIEAGVLKSFQLSDFVARKTGLHRVTNTAPQTYVMRPGNQSLDELIKQIDYGLLVGRFSGGDPGIGGDYSGVAKNSFLIKNGRVADAVSETMVSGNLASLLRSLIGLSRETVADGMTVLPWAAFSGVTISGK